MIPTVHLIYFSPTGTTKTIVTRVAEGLAAQETVHHDMTKPGSSRDTLLHSGIAVIGLPVYAGRVPETCLQRLSTFQAEKIPTVLVALYGNRAYEDALVELRDLVSDQGFQVIAAGAFIGEHSYATVEYPVALGRPDSSDQALAAQFGRRVAEKAAQGQWEPPQIAGDIPYRERVQFGGIAPDTNPDLCTLCGACAAACPVDIIRVGSKVETDAARCIMCCACVKQCSPQARIFDDPFIVERRALLARNCSVPRQPEFFL